MKIDWPAIILKREMDGKANHGVQSLIQASRILQQRKKANA